MNCEMVDGTLYETEWKRISQSWKGVSHNISVESR